MTERKQIVNILYRTRLQETYQHRQVKNTVTFT